MKSTDQPPASDLQPPNDGQLSALLNGVGNGTMLGALPLLGGEVYAVAAKKPLPEFARVTGVIGSAVGAVVGGILGLREHKHLSAYRNRIASEVSALRDDVYRVQANGSNWQERANAASPTPTNERA